MIESLTPNQIGLVVSIRYPHGLSFTGALAGYGTGREGPWVEVGTERHLLSGVEAFVIERTPASRKYWADVERDAIVAANQEFERAEYEARKSEAIRLAEMVP